MGPAQLPVRRLSEKNLSRGVDLKPRHSTTIQMPRLSGLNNLWEIVMHVIVKVGSALALTLVIGWIAAAWPFVDGSGKFSMTTGRRLRRSNAVRHRFAAIPSSHGSIGRD